MPSYLQSMKKEVVSPLSLLIWISVLAGSLNGCQQANPHQQNIDQLTQLDDSIALKVRDLEAIPADSVSQAARWAETNLRELELLLSGGRVEIDKSEGYVISEVSRTHRLLKDHASRRTSLLQGAERAHLQLSQLADALSQRATQDAAGTAIDSGYISENVILEVRVSRELIQALDETIGLAQRGMHLASQTKASNDSLQTILRARLARAVLEDS